MTYKYSYQKSEENTARAVLLDAPISTKQSIEVCSKLRTKTVEYAKKFLEGVKKKEKAVKYTRFTEGAGHKKGIGPGKYPIKTAGYILKLVQSAESNATSKGLGSDLKIVHLSAQRASTPWHQGRLRRRKMKRSHIELVVQEITHKTSKKQESTKQEIQNKDTKEKQAEKKEDKK
ncbi:MAG: 50S ribosomal protein L22 [Nanoarchaeota archaeon]|nr:50S ribosomal protein L22 [Nanoarchaeota archaeon]MBU1269131.1 50S ribosomal protein L22 [Nanoarchaeota archaeon]MBU1605093.1 50S ribosomal protein L22 [Nanoarchaeota archaeon]MBU2442774.1 50S ribosomal protein L22 [Nanoarchaeota archaeon]